jgi:hypothetical protein
MIDDILNIKVNVDPANGIKQIRKFDKEFIRGVKDVRSQMKVLDREQKGYFSATRNAWRDMQDEIDASSEAMADYEKSIRETELALNVMESQLARVADGSEEMTDAVLEATKARQAAMKETVASAKEAREQLAEVGSATISIKMKAMTEELKESLSNVAAPITKVLNKDIKGAFESGGELAAAAITEAAKHMGKFTSKGGSALGRMGTSLATKGADKGGIGGKAMEGVGAAMKGMGGIMGKLGPMIGSLAKLGPILSMTAGALVAIVKLMIDAEAQAKEFQKDLLASASTGEFLAKNAYRADAAFEDLKGTVTDIRNSAFNLKQNLDWGTTSKDHLAFRNVLTQEGVSIARMADEFDRAKKAGQATGDAVTYYGQQTAVAIAYSRNFGVALNDITQFQAQMMTELGSSFQDVNKEFANMQIAAGDSGMAMNKFFAIMRGVSSDLSLYNMRMEDAVGLLNKLGKVMSPQNAQKFMGTLMQGFKGMGRLDRLRMTLLAGEGKTRQVFEKDAKNRETALAQKLSSQAKIPLEAAQKAVADYGKGQKTEFNNLVKGLEGGGALKEAAIELKIRSCASDRQPRGHRADRHDEGRARAVCQARGEALGYGGRAWAGDDGGEPRHRARAAQQHDQARRGYGRGARRDGRLWRVYQGAAGERR